MIEKLKQQFPTGIVGEVSVAGQSTIEVQKERLIEVLRYLKEGVHPGFEVLMDLTGVDQLSPLAGVRVYYFIHNPSTLERVRLMTFVPREERLSSATVLFEGADWYERELYDLFGVLIDGHPDMKRILMPDDWVGHPLRRDYPLTEESVAFKHDRVPKVPSAIISDAENYNVVRLDA